VMLVALSQNFAGLLATVVNDKVRGAAVCDS
jgi:hypothetical protein